MGEHWPVVFVVLPYVLFLLITHNHHEHLGQMISSSSAFSHHFTFYYWNHFVCMCSLQKYSSLGKHVNLQQRSLQLLDARKHKLSTYIMNYLKFVYVFWCWWSRSTRTPVVNVVVYSWLYPVSGIPVMHWAVGRQCQCEYGSLPFFWGKGQRWWWWWDGGGGGGVHFCGALAHSIPSLSSWQRAPALLLSLLCRIYQIVASILLRCFIPCTFSCVLNTLWVPSGSLVLSHDSSHSNSLLFSNKSTVPVQWTHSAVCSYRVFGRSVVCSLLVKAPMWPCNTPISYHSSDDVGQNKMPRHNSQRD